MQRYSNFKKKFGLIFTENEKEVDGKESQDKGITKRVKTSKLVKDIVAPEVLLGDYYTKDDLSFDNNMIKNPAHQGLFGITYYLYKKLL